jgi:hypothetical protein
MQMGVMEVASLRTELSQLRSENAALRNTLLALQGEVYGAKLTAKYLDKELAGRLISHSLMYISLEQNRALACLFYQASLLLKHLIYSETSIHHFHRGLKKKRWIRENNRCGSHSLNRIRSGTTEIEQKMWENELFRNDR